MHSRLLNVGLWVALALCLVVYHLTNIFVATLSDDLISIVKVVQFASFGGFVLIFMNSELVARLFLRSGFLGGRYYGTSTPINAPPPEADAKHDEIQGPHDDTIVVRQTLLKTTLSGKSCQKGAGKLVSTWSGTLFKDEGCTYWFAMELHTRHGEHGILKLNYEEGTLEGFYWSGDPDHPAVASLKATRAKGSMQAPNSGLAAVGWRRH